MKGFRRSFTRVVKVKSPASKQVLGTKLVAVHATRVRAPKAPKMK